MYLSVFLSAAWLFVSLIGGIYNEQNILSFETFSKRSTQGAIYFTAIVACGSFFFRDFTISKLFTTTIILSIPLALFINRFLYLAIYTYFKNKDYLMDKVVVIGYNNLSKKLIDSLRQNEINKQVIGICEEEENVRELSNYPILGNIQNAFEVCKANGATEIYSSIAPENNSEIYKIMQLADEHCMHFKIVPDIGVFVNRKGYINNLNGIPLITLRKDPLEDLGNRIKKRAFDIAISLFVLLFILSWLIPIISLLIWLDNRGPIFFTQMRSGKNNLQFKCLKFRSMKVHNFNPEKQATKDDDRFTRVGRFLRRTSLDEFPQFINVLKGDMSIVGPRPHMLKHTDEFSRVANQYMVRHFLKPGISGWAQVNGYRGEVDTLEKLQGRVERDVWYLENWSVWLDWKIVFLTAFNAIKGEANAY
jgi:putative colanic acid biosynthesis UDP-glucose lipid carrier transferase